jgi:hypothetical protein
MLARKDRPDRRRFMFNPSNAGHYMCRLELSFPSFLRVFEEMHEYVYHILEFN